jgi:RNA polymerase sporulation-specific sigma factor
LTSSSFFFSKEGTNRRKEVEAVKMVGLYLNDYKHDVVANNQINIDLFTRLKNCKDEDIKRCIKEDIFLSNIRSVHYVMRRYQALNRMCQIYRVTYDDFFSSAYFGLLKAIESFDIDKGIQFMTYAYRCMNNEILMLLRRFRKTQFDLSLGKVLHKGMDGSEITMEEMIEDDTAIDMFEKIILDDLYNVILIELEKTLSNRDFTLYQIHLEGECTQAELADLFNISQSYVSRITTKCDNKVRSVYEKMTRGSSL